ncbi:MAG TPA: hypothetical protein PLI19_02390 [Erysipelotrichaceae bacterium]|nr:hypothetical protein [Erysipelotrichaceae bacterium]
MIIIIFAIVTEPYTKWYHRLADILVYNNYNHYLPCSALPELSEVEEIVLLHQDVIEQIENLSSEGNIEVVIDSLTCSGKGSIIIYYASKAERKLIDEILPDKTFFGIPISLINR